MTTVEEILKEKGKTVHALGPQATMMEALKIMTTHKIGAVLVIENNKILGIFSERDCVQNLAQLSECPRPRLDIEQRRQHRRRIRDPQRPGCQDRPTTHHHR